MGHLVPEEGWEVLRFWDFEIEQDAVGVANKVRTAVDAARISTLGAASDGSRGRH
jgi:very-short-patch-repair endonuclease